MALGMKHTLEAKRKMSLDRKDKHVSPKTEIKKGQHLSIKTEFKKGAIQPKAEKSFNWKGGRNKDAKGYLLIYSPNHPFIRKSGYVTEHRLVVEKFLGRYLKPEEVVHHINEIKEDNRIENLFLFSNDKLHRRFHILKKHNSKLIEKDFMKLKNQSGQKGEC